MARPKIDRSAFLYFDPKAPKSRFAQCGSCMMFVPDHERCTIHGPDVPVAAGSTCGLYVHGKPMPGAHVMCAVTPEESGLEHRKVRCENCAWFDAARSRCKLFGALNAMAPATFALDLRVEPQGCCNANTPKDDA